MPTKIFDAIIYIRKPPTYHFREGLVHVCYPIGTQATGEFVMQPNVFLKAVRDATKLADEFRERKSVVPLHKRADSKPH
jgi:hypothetical protein